ncbi:coagulation factor 5/8 type domain-containing protein [Streptomyces griseoviridis]|uniref:OAA-family lectin sugar binding domain-containing protein n=1 Tax=Streptomyces griseoviridis TaxID=45398 RepID=A0ABT9LQW9_STRGD|nr:coagulation factor 5/8 type domain-containing protein [Streptomyces griseoviridis]MDP9685942.1 hypothetical protein [Streptomyces griseoviridis]GGS78274.1 hypothetical protein GCM10010240_09300 [Streptomyces griseoviridis]
MHDQSVPPPDDGSGGAPPLVYDTEVRADEGGWRPAPRLVLGLDRGGPAEVVELAWRSGSGAEAVLVLDDGMRAFRGHRRSADDVREEYRGVRRGPAGSAGEDGAEWRSQVFATEEERPDGRGTDAGRLRLVLDDGHGPVERVTWRDAHGTFVSLALRTGRRAPGTVPVPVARVVASAEHAAAGEVARNLLRPGRGKWLALDSAATLDFVLPAPAVVTGYRLTSADDCRDRDPRDWRLRGSVDGTTWYTLDLRDGQTFPERHQSRVYAVANSTAYPRYRLDIDRNWGRQAETQLGRVELFTTEEDGLLGTPLPLPRLEAGSEYRAAGEVAANVRASGAGKWLSFGRTARLDFTLDAPALVTGYTLASADDHCSRDPRDWVLLGSEDGEAWTVLDRRAGELFPERFQVREFAASASVPYSRYRLHITANAEGVGEVQLNRVQLLAAGAAGPRPERAEFSGLVRHGTGPAVAYRGTGLDPAGRRTPPVVPDAAEATEGTDGTGAAKGTAAKEQWGRPAAAVPAHPGPPEGEQRACRTRGLPGCGRT